MPRGTASHRFQKACLRAGLFFLGTFLLWAATPVFQQDGEEGLLSFGTPVHAQRLPFLTYSIEQGLSESVAYDLLEDEAGTLWIATGYGLNNFDGFTFRQYYTSSGLTGNKLYALAQDSGGRLWLGLDNGLNVMVGDTLFYPPGFESLRRSKVQSLHVDREGRLWIGTEGAGLWMAEWGRSKGGNGRESGAQPGVGRESGVQSGAGRGSSAQSGVGRGSSAQSGVGRGSGAQSGAVGDDVPAPSSLVQFTTAQGLPDLFIQDVLQDADGTLWVATRSGLARLASAAGSSAPKGRFQTLTRADGGLTDDFTRVLLEVPGDGIWVGTRGGISVLREGRVVRRITTRQGLANERIQSLSLGLDGEVWIGTEDGLAVYRNGRITSFNTQDGLSNPVVTSTLVDREGDVWVGTFGGGINQFLGEYFYNSTVDQGLPNNVVTNFASTPDGALWVSTFGGGLLRLDSEGRREVFTQADGLLDNKIFTLHVDALGGLWVGTQWGINWIDPRTRRIHSIPPDQFPFGIVRDIHPDPLGRGMWVATYESGLHLLGPRPTGRSGAAVSSSALAPYRQGSFGLQTAPFEPLLPRDLSLLASIDVETGLASNVVMGLQTDSLGTLWAATYNGIHVLNVERLTPSPGIPSRQASPSSTLDPAEGTSAGRRIGSENRPEILEILTLEDGLPSNAVIHLYRDRDGHMWASTFLGSARFRGGRFETVYLEQEGAEMISYFLVQDEEGMYWMGTNIGLIGFDAQAWFSASDGLEMHRSMRRLTKRQGLIANELNASAVFADQDGSFWLGSVEGMSQFYPSRLPELRSEPGIQLESVTVSGRSVLGVSNRVFSHDRNNLTFSFKGISLASPDQILYRYRLGGLNWKWAESYNRTISYPTLPPGEYTFQVHAVNADGRISGAPAVFTFEIRPPFWFQIWFIVLVVSLVIGIAWFTFQYLRVRKAVEMERVRVQIASDLHDDVGASLTELALQTDFLLAGSVEPSVRETLEKLGQQSRRIVSGLDDIVWSIDARNDTVGDVTDRIQDYANQVFRNGGVDVHYDLQDARMGQRLPVTVKENLYLIAKEALNNVAKHAEATRVDITLAITPRSFTLRIADNGRGVAENGRETADNGRGAMAPSSADRGNGEGAASAVPLRKSGQGMRNMDLRAKRMDATLEIRQSPGFEVMVSGPLKG